MYTFKLTRGLAPVAVLSALAVGGCGSGTGLPNPDRLEVTPALRQVCSGVMEDHELQAALFTWETDRQHGTSREHELSVALGWRCDPSPFPEWLAEPEPTFDAGQCTECIIAGMNQVYGVR